MAMSCIKSLGSITISNEVLGIVGRRTFAAGAPKKSTLSREVKSTTGVGANIFKEGADPKFLADSDYPDWLWHLVDKSPALSELRKKNTETLPYDDLKGFVKLDNRARIKANNSMEDQEVIESP